MSRVGLMLYTVRDECARDLRATLDAVAALGYEGVELHELFGHSPRDVRTWLEELELTAAGWHVALAELEERLDDVIGQAVALGTDRLVVPWIETPATSTGAEAMADRLEALAQEASGRGATLCFHNHVDEVRSLEDGRSFLDRLLERDIALELDIGWAWFAGADPAELLERARGRFPLVHVKDFRGRAPDVFCPVGEGLVGYEQLLPILAETEAEWLLVEQDETVGSSLEAAERSLAFLAHRLETA